MGNYFSKPKRGGDEWEEIQHNETLHADTVVIEGKINQYSTASNSACAFIVAEAALAFLQNGVPVDRETAAYVITKAVRLGATAHPDSSHTNMETVLEHECYQPFLRDAGYMGCLAGKPGMDHILRLMEKRLKQHGVGPVVGALTKSPETILIAIWKDAIGRVTYGIFDSHPRPSCNIKNAYIMTFLSEDALLDWLAKLIPSVNLGGMSELEQQILNTVEIKFLQLKYEHDPRLLHRESFVSEKMSEIAIRRQIEEQMIADARVRKQEEEGRRTAEEEERRRGEEGRQRREQESADALFAAMLAQEYQKEAEQEHQLYREKETENKQRMQRVAMHDGRTNDMRGVRDSKWVSPMAAPCGRENPYDVLRQITPAAGLTSPYATNNDDGSIVCAARPSTSATGRPAEGWGRLAETAHARLELKSGHQGHAGNAPADVPFTTHRDIASGSRSASVAVSMGIPPGLGKAGGMQKGSEKDVGHKTKTYALGGSRRIVLRSNSASGSAVGKLPSPLNEEGAELERKDMIDAAIEASLLHFRRTSSINPATDDRRDSEYNSRAYDGHRSRSAEEMEPEKEHLEELRLTLLRSGNGKVNSREDYTQYKMPEEQNAALIRENTALVNKLRDAERESARREEAAAKQIRALQDEIKVLREHNRQMAKPQQIEKPAALKANAR
ncbi:hypothetical protein HK101_009866 [Irineochytrium annulatum]|nr:hypothetical protein HK101_009866 [Irineochytrium annulatum]